MVWRSAVDLYFPFPFFPFPGFIDASLVATEPALGCTLGLAAAGGGAFPRDASRGA